MNRHQWLEERKKGIGGSDISAILGINPYCTPYQLWLDKTGRAEPKEETPAMRFGKMAENLVIKYWEETTSNKCYTTDKEHLYHKKHAQYAFLMGSPDGTYMSKESGNFGILECKTTNFIIVPEDARFMPFYCQLQWYIGLVDSSKDDRVVYDEGEIAILNCITKEFNHYHFDFDQEIFESMKEKAIYFWENHVLKDIPPEPLNVDDIKLIYKKHTSGKSIEASFELSKKIETLCQLNEKIKLYSSLKESYKNEIKTIMKDAESIIDSDGNPLIIWKYCTDGVKFYESAFKLEHPDLYNKFLKSTTGSRRFSIK